MAGVALDDMDCYFAWQAWHLWHWVGSGGALGPPSLCVAGVSLDDMDCYFARQAWHLWHWVGSGGALGQPWRRDAAAFCVAGGRRGTS